MSDNSFVVKISWSSYQTIFLSIWDWFGLRFVCIIILTTSWLHRNANKVTIHMREAWQAFKAQILTIQHYCLLFSITERTYLVLSWWSNETAIVLKLKENWVLGFGTCFSQKLFRSLWLVLFELSFTWIKLCSWFSFTLSVLLMLLQSIVTCEMKERSWDCLKTVLQHSTSWLSSWQTDNYSNQTCKFSNLLFALIPPSLLIINKSYFL